MAGTATSAGDRGECRASNDLLVVSTRKLYGLPVSLSELTMSRLSTVSGLLLAGSNIAESPERPRGEGIFMLQKSQQADWSFAEKELPVCT